MHPHKTVNRRLTRFKKISYHRTMKQRSPSPKLLRARYECLKALRSSKMKPCPTCHGEGHDDSRKDWRMTNSQGRKDCFRCDGTGLVKPAWSEPLKVRDRVAEQLKPLVIAADVLKISDLEAQCRESLYWPVLDDVFLHALNIAEKRAGC